MVNTRVHGHPQLLHPLTHRQRLAAMLSMMPDIPGPIWIS
jgi:hypothetical protein